jgi:hypothetical protein
VIAGQKGCGLTSCLCCNRTLWPRSGMVSNPSPMSPEILSCHEAWMVVPKIPRCRCCLMPIGSHIFHFCVVQCLGLSTAVSEKEHTHAWMYGCTRCLNIYFHVSMHITEHVLKKHPHSSNYAIARADVVTQCLHVALPVPTLAF